MRFKATREIQVNRLKLITLYNILTSFGNNKIGYDLSQISEITCNDIKGKKRVLKVFEYRYYINVFIYYIIK